MENIDDLKNENKKLRNQVEQKDYQLKSIKA